MTRHLPRICSLISLLVAGTAQAWGPHPEITQAALDALVPNDALILQLGSQAQRLTNYAWMADFRRLPFEEPNEFFYADDYLIFPGVSNHLDHILPEVKQTFSPYFKRALQALRTENSTNAARWIGSLLHFAEDTGSPPHAAQIRGDLHTKMENWVDAKAIHIPGYQPQLLGTNDDAALDGFSKRMDQLIEFSKARAQKLRVPVMVGNRAAAMPIVLESALETSRVIADLLHTLGQLSRSGGKQNTVLRGTILGPAPVGPLEKFPAKVVLEGTPYSTLTDLAGKFEFRNWSAGAYQIAALRAGAGLARKSLNLVAGETNECVIKFAEEGSRMRTKDEDEHEINLIRNGDFQLRWARRDAPDCWWRNEGAWEGEIIPLKIGQRYRLRAKFRGGPLRGEGDPTVVVRRTRYLPHAVPRTAAIPKFETRTLTATSPPLIFTATEQLGLVQISLRSKGDPSATWEYVSLAPIAGE